MHQFVALGKRERYPLFSLKRVFDMKLRYIKLVLNTLILMLGSQIGKALDFDSSNCRFDPYPSSIYRPIIVLGSKWDCKSYPKGVEFDSP